MLSYINFIVIILFPCFGGNHQYVNLALNKPAWQSSNNVDTKWFARAAVDGDIRQTAAYDTCAITKKSLFGTWWVDLVQLVWIHYIDIYYRYESTHAWESVYRWRMAGFFVYVSNTTKKEDGYLCFHEIQNVTHPPTSVMSIPCEQYGRYVIYYNERRSEFTFPAYYSEYIWNALCEVEVYACNNFTYGTQCANKCGDCLDGQKCDPITGACRNGCAAGRRGVKCDTECLPGSYGINCKKYCSANCKYNPVNPCSMTSGECTLGCKAGWLGVNCDKACDNFYFGTNCKNKCGKCLEGRRCNHVDGICMFGCGSGWTGDKCDTRCQETFYGNDCKFNCSTDCINRTCYADTGVCVKPINMIEDVQKDRGPLIGGLVGGLLLCIGILVVAGILFASRRISRRRNESSNEYADIDMTSQNDKHIYSTTESRYQNFTFGAK